jgi:hypothetical protein
MGRVIYHNGFDFKDMLLNFVIFAFFLSMNI